METIININSTDRFVNVTIKEDDGSVIEKKITFQNFREVFKEQVREKYYLLSPLYDDYENAGRVEGLLIGETGGGICRGIFFIPADSRYMDVAGEKSVMPYPSILFMLKARNGKLESSECFAMKEKNVDKLKMDSLLYAFPFGNVQASSAGICWGNNKLPALYGYEDLRTAITMFFSSESNMDYVRKGESYASSYGTYMDFLGTLHSMDSFPNKALVLSPCVRTLGDLIKTFDRE